MPYKVFPVASSYYSLLFMQMLVLALFCSVTGNAQTLEFKNYSTKNGIMSDEVYNLHQDQQGYIWIFSPLGTVKYNGFEFKPVLKNLPVKESFMYSICENKEGRKWVANSNAHIYEIRHDSAFLIKGIDSISVLLQNSTNEIGKMAVDDSLNIYAITKGPSYKFVRNSGRYSARLLNGIGSRKSAKIKLIEVGTELLQIADRHEYDEFYYYAHHIIYLHLKQDLLYELTGIPIPHNFKKFRNTTYFIRGNTLVWIDKKKGICSTQLPAVVICYTKDKNDHIWIGCLNDGLYELDEQNHIIAHYFPGTTVNSVLIDHQAGLWASTTGSGAYYCKNIKSLFFKEAEPLSCTISCLKVIDRKLFVATTRGDVFMLRENTWIRLRKADNTTPVDMVSYKNTILLFFKVKVERLDLMGKKEPSKFIDMTIAQYNAFMKGSDTIICTWKRGITYYIKDLPVKRIDFNRKIVSSLLVDTTLWLGTNEGVYTYRPVFRKQGKKQNTLLIPDRDSLVEEQRLKEMQEIKVVNFIKDKAGNIWFCTMGQGIFKLLGKQLIKYSTADGLPADIINHISFSENNLTLLSTNAGLFISATDKIGFPAAWKNIYTGNITAALVFENRIYAAAKNGLVIFNGSDAMNGKDSLFFNLISIEVDSKEISPENFNVVSSDPGSIEFKFDVVSFSEAMPLVKYFLQGSICDSGLTDNALIRFNRLAPGNYTLSAFPVVKGGKNLQQFIPFYVEAAFWQTPWFVILIIIVCLLIIVFSSCLIIRINKKRTAVKVKNDQLLLEYKLIALKAQINPHFMSNCLSAIQHLIKSNKTGEATTYIAKFGFLVRQILNFSSKPVITLIEELNLLEVYIELEQLRFENKFTFTINVENSLGLKAALVPPLLLNPIVENAIWHGLLPMETQRQACLKIEIKQAPGILMILVEDNGVGRSYKKKDINNKSESHGIKITEQRLLNLNYLYNTGEAQMTYTDLKNKAGTPIGTRVTIYLPLNLRSV